MTTDDPRPARDRYAALLEAHQEWLAEDDDGYDERVGAALDEILREDRPRFRQPEDIWTPEELAALVEEAREEARLREDLDGVLMAELRLHNCLNPPIFTEPTVYSPPAPWTRAEPASTPSPAFTILRVERTTAPPPKPFTPAEVKHIAALAPIVADALDQLFTTGERSLILEPPHFLVGPMLAPKDDDR